MRVGLGTTVVGPALALILAGCTGATPGLVYPVDSVISAAVGDRADGVPMLIGSIELCVPTPFGATITEVAIHDPTGQPIIEAFGVRPNPGRSGEEMIGTSDGTLAAYGHGFDPAAEQQVSSRCSQGGPDDPNGDWSELAVQVSRHEPDDVAGGKSLDVRYHTPDGISGTLNVPFGIWVCRQTCPANPGHHN